MWSSFPLSQHLKIRITWIYSTALFWPEGKAFLNYYSSGLKKKRAKTVKLAEDSERISIQVWMKDKQLVACGVQQMCAYVLVFCAFIVVLARIFCGWESLYWAGNGVDEIQTRRCWCHLDYWSWQNFWVGALVQAKMCSYKKSEVRGCIWGYLCLFPQMCKLRGLCFNAENEPVCHIVDNWRPCQPLKSREVRASFQ